VGDCRILNFLRERRRYYRESLLQELMRPREGIRASFQGFVQLGHKKECQEYAYIIVR
jgi:hypothetical protein